MANLQAFERSEYQQVKADLHRKILDRLDLEKLGRSTGDSAREEVLILIRNSVNSEAVPLSFAEREQLSREILDEIFGLGPLEPLLKDPTISDILVNRFDRVYVERAGKLEITGLSFKDNQHLMQIIDRIVSRIGRRVDESSPMVDARLQDGSRVNAIIPPLALDGACLSIRRFGRDPVTARNMLDNKTLTEPMLELLSAMVKGRLNLMISGGTGAGKTTVLNVLSGYIPNSERIVTIEDAAELQLKQEHVVRLETRPPNIEGKGVGAHAPARHQQPAYASRPHRGGRGAWRRGLRHAAGHEYRPRRFAHHRPRQLPARCAGPHREHGVHGQPEYSRARHSPADRQRRPCRGPGRASFRRHRARSSPSPRSPAWKAT